MSSDCISGVAVESTGTITQKIVRIKCHTVVHRQMATRDDDGWAPFTSRSVVFPLAYPVNQDARENLYISSTLPPLKGEGPTKPDITRLCYCWCLLCKSTIGAITTRLTSPRGKASSLLGRSGLRGVFSIPLNHTLKPRKTSDQSQDSVTD